MPNKELKKLYLSNCIKYENQYIKSYIDELEQVSLNIASEFVENDNEITNETKIKLLEYLVDRKIKETDYSKCKHISALEYLNDLDKEDGDI